MDDPDLNLELPRRRLYSPPPIPDYVTTVTPQILKEIAEIERHAQRNPDPERLIYEAAALDVLRKEISKTVTYLRKAAEVQASPIPWTSKKRPKLPKHNYR